MPINNYFRKKNFIADLGLKFISVNVEMIRKQPKTHIAASFRGIILKLVRCYLLRLAYCNECFCIFMHNRLGLEISLKALIITVSF